MKKIKTIDINAREWFDKVNGNSYFSGSVVVNYGLPSEKTFLMPFQYGYGDAYIQAASDLLKREKLIPETWSAYLWRDCRENNIILRKYIQTGCKKRDLV